MKSFAIAATVAALGFASSASAASIVGLYNTGVDNNNVSVIGSTIDLHWEHTGGTAYVAGQNGVFPLNGPWLSDDAVSRWIGPTPNAGDSTDPRNDGFYEYTLDFNLVGAIGANFAGRFAADNGVSWIRLNNTQLVDGTVTPVGGFSSWTNFSANSGFLEGSNTLTVRVINFSQNGGNPSGLRVEFLNSAVGVVPEPGTWALMILGFGGAGAMIRSNRRRSVAA